MRLFRSPIPFHHAPRKVGHGGVPLPLRYLPAALGLHDTVNGDLHLMPDDLLCCIPENETCGIQCIAVKKRELLLYGFLQSGISLRIRDRVVREIHMEPRPCGLPALRLHVAPAWEDGIADLRQLFRHVLRVHPVLWIVAVAVVAVRHAAVRLLEIVHAAVAALKLPAHMVERRGCQAVLLIVYHTLDGIAAVLRIPPAV